jgi:hypothetical protein
MPNFLEFLNEDLQTDLKRLGLARSKFGVGKLIGGNLYFHKSYLEKLPMKIQFDVRNAQEKISSNFNYVAIKYNMDGSDVSFIASPDFDSSNEPIVGISMKVTSKGKVTTTPPSNDPLIWHHKWQWVMDDYQGFNVEESKLRSIEWKSKLGTNKDISNRIGRLSFWNQWTDENGLSEETEDLDFTEDQYPISFLTSKDINEMEFSKLLKNTDEKRLQKAEKQVRTTPPKSFKLKNDFEMLKFNVKAFPSKENARHKGYIIHDESGDVKQVFCDCKDFFHRMYKNLINTGMATLDLPSEYKGVFAKYNNKQPPEVAYHPDDSYICKHIASMKKYMPN